MALTSSRSLDLASDDWRANSSCRDTDPALFFPVGTTGPALEQIAAAKAVCDTCESKEPCLAVRAEHQPGLRRLGRHLRGGAPQAAPGVRRPAAPPGRCRRRFLSSLAAGARRHGRAPTFSSFGLQPDGPASPSGRPLRVLVDAVDDRHGQRHGHALNAASPGRAGAKSIEPSSSLTSDRTMERPRLLACPGSQPAGGPTPSSITLIRSACASWVSTTWTLDRASAGTVPGGKTCGRVGVVDDVLQQLGEHHGERRRDR